MAKSRSFAAKAKAVWRAKAVAVFRKMCEGEHEALLSREGQEEFISCIEAVEEQCQEWGSLLRQHLTWHHVNSHYAQAERGFLEDVDGQCDIMQFRLDDIRRIAKEALGKAKT